MSTNLFWRIKMPEKGQSLPLDMKYAFQAQDGCMTRDRVLGMLDMLMRNCDEKSLEYQSMEELKRTLLSYEHEVEYFIKD